MRYLVSSKCIYFTFSVHCARGVVWYTLVHFFSQGGLPTRPPPLSMYAYAAYLPKVFFSFHTQSVFTWKSLPLCLTKMSLFMSDNCKLLTSQFSSTHPPWEKSIHNPEPIVAVADCWPLFGGKKRSDLSDMFEVFENAKNWKSFLTPFGPLCTVRKNIFNLIALNTGDHFRIQVKYVSYLKKVSVPGFVPLTFQSEVRSLIHYTTKSWLQMWVCLVYYKGIISTVVFFPSKDGCCYYA